MDDDELAQRFQALTTRLDQQKADADRLRQDHDQLSNKLRTPGTQFLVDLEYRLVFDQTLTVGAGALAPSVPWPSPVFETLPGALHAVYAVSAFCTDSTTPVIITDGSAIVGPADAISVGVQRQMLTGPTRIAMTVVIYNSTVNNRSIAVRVWRRLGMGS